MPMAILQCTARPLGTCSLLRAHLTSGVRFDAGVYTLSGWARAAPTTTTVKLGAKGCLTGTPADLQEVTIPSNTTSWRRFFVPVRVNQTSCSIFFSTMGAGYAWSTLDDVIFRKTTRPIVDVALTRADNSTPVRYNSSSSKFIFSDGFMTSWGANDHLYTITNDTRGWNNATHASRGRNLSLDSLA